MRPIQLGLMTSVVLVSAGLCEARPLNTRERDFVAAVEAAVGAPAGTVDKTIQGTGRDRVVTISLKFADTIELYFLRHARAAKAFEAASQNAALSSMADDPMLTEVRGRDLLVLEGPLTDAGLLEKLRDAVWQAHPWSRPTRRTALYHLNLQEDGMAVRVNKPSGLAYQRLELLWIESQAGAAAAAANPAGSDSSYEIVSATELKVEQPDGITLHMRFEPRRATLVAAPTTNPKQVLVEAAELVGLPLALPTAGGATGALGASTSGNP